MTDSSMAEPEQVAAAVDAIHTGDVATLSRLLDEYPDLARARLAHRDGRTLLHVATDWPGHFPQVATTIAILIGAGADPDAALGGPHQETPLHWAASSDDLDALDALLDGGADINAPGAVIAGGTPLADATVFGQWAAARRLLQRGAARRSGRPQPWVSTPASGSSSTRTHGMPPAARTSPEPSGGHATAAGSTPRPASSRRAPTSTGSAGTA
ncbi:MAG: ankyrin repeat domain-containing protein [Kineosporiaceae bacterium]